MGLAQIHVNAVAGTTPLADQGHQATGRDSDADAGGVGDAPAWLLVPADRPFGLGDAADRDRLPLPAVETKDAVCLSHGEPPFDIGDLPAPLLALADVGPIEGCGEGSQLLEGEAGRRNLRGFWR